MSGIEALDYWDDDELIAALYQDELEDAIKASFGGDRSAAGRYAANIRWKGHVKDQPGGTNGGGDDPVSVAFRGARDAISALRKAPAIYAGAAASPEGWASDRYNNYATVLVNVRGKPRVVAGKLAVEAEQKVRALGAAVYDRAANMLIAEGVMDKAMYEEWGRFNDEGPQGVVEAQERLVELNNAIGNKDAAVLPPAVLQAVTDREEVTSNLVDARLRLRDVGKQIKEQNKIGYFSNASYEERMAARDKSKALQKEYEELNKETQLLSNQLDDANVFFRKSLADWTEYQDVVPLASGRGTKVERDRMSAITKLLGDKSIEIMGTMVKMDGKLIYDFPVPDSKEIRTVYAGKQQPKTWTAGEAIRAGAAAVERLIPAAILNEINKPKSYVELYNYRLARDEATTYDAREVDRPIGFQSSSSSNRTISIITNESGGGAYSPATRLITYDGDESTLVHEIGHAMTYAIPEFRLMEQAHYQTRTFGKVGDTRSFDKKLKTGPQKLVSGSEKGHGFPGEYRLDKWVQPYMGRDYGTGRSGGASLEATEVLTKGLESVRGSEWWSIATTGRIDRAAAQTALGSLIAIAAALEAEQ